MDSNDPSDEMGLVNSHEEMSEGSEHCCEVREEPTKIRTRICEQR